MANKQKNKRDIKKIATRIMAIILASMMVLSVAGTLVYYIVYAAK